MNQKQVKKLKNGIYLLTWKRNEAERETSLAAVGTTLGGNKWFSATKLAIGAMTAWDCIERADLLLAGDEDTKENILKENRRYSVKKEDNTMSKTTLKINVLDTLGDMEAGEFAVINDDRLSSFIGCIVRLIDTSEMVWAIVSAEKCGSIIGAVNKTMKCRILRPGDEFTVKI